MTKEFREHREHEPMSVPSIPAPEYFPEQDKAKIKAWREDNFRKAVIEGSANYYDDLLEPSEDPELIFQGHFAISELEPVKIGGAQECIGVVLINKHIGGWRVMATHLETRGDYGISDEHEITEELKKEAEKFVSMMKELFNESPSKIFTVSTIMGSMEYHQSVHDALKQSFPHAKRIAVSAESITVDPKQGRIGGEGVLSRKSF